MQGECSAGERSGGREALKPKGRGERGQGREGAGAGAIRGGDKKGGAAQSPGCVEGASIGGGWAARKLHPRFIGVGRECCRDKC